MTVGFGVVGFGVVEFQLVLLRRMADFQPGLVERARSGLGCSAMDMRQVNADWQRFVRSRTAPRGVARYTAVLGPQDSVREQRTGDLTCLLHHWSLPLWPELRFEAVEGPDRGVWQEWLVRAPGTEPPAVPATGELAPWQYVVTDLERLSPEVRHLPADAPQRWVSQFALPDAEGTLHHRRARFVYGLLQEVSELDRPR
ncbi:hypothetical protein ACEZCY_00970 [Streptacidiphilus sp. N1-12]|uniref:Polyketide cyclase / dehydrase and lipid transport n=2 Tax=Streptacidiphilus alkalitolerans TaxID=3342712 RepID=A0ABV6V2C2_9ACTN